MECALATDIGLLREENQDIVRAEKFADNILWLYSSYILLLISHCHLVIHIFVEYFSQFCGIDILFPVTPAIFEANNQMRLEVYERNQAIFLAYCRYNIGIQTPQ